MLSWKTRHTSIPVFPTSQDGATSRWLMTQQSILLMNDTYSPSTPLSQDNKTTLISDMSAIKKQSYHSDKIV